MFQVRTSSGEPIYLQLMRQVKHAVATGSLRAGERLPTVRELAAELVVNANTVGRAYRELEREGVLETSPGRGSFVRNGTERLPARLRRERLRPFVEQLIAEARALGFSGEELEAEVRAASRALERTGGGE